MAKRIVRESKTEYTVNVKASESFAKPLVIRRKGRRVAVVVPITEYKQFIAWRQIHSADTEKTTRRTRVSRKRKQGDFANLIGIFKAAPGQEPIDFSALMNKHGYEQIDRDDS